VALRGEMMGGYGIGYSGTMAFKNRGGPSEFKVGMTLSEIVSGNVQAAFEKEFYLGYGETEVVNYSFDDVEPFGFYNLDMAIESIDFNTIGLLFGMMILVVILEKTGIFQYLAIYTTKKSKGNPWLLLVALTGLTSILSMILDNVTTIILIAPVTIIVARTINVNPTPFLFAEAILSNVGGTATLVGDPPNIMIGSAASLSFNDFLIHSLPVVLVVWVITLFVLKFFYRKTLSSGSESIERLNMMNEKEAITDSTTLKRMLIILGIVVLLFFLHGLLHLEPSIIALMGAAFALLLVQAKEDPQPILEKTELSVLLFFISLFVLVGGLEHTGVLSMISSHLLSGAANNLLLTAIILLWGSALLSSLVDNIPFVTAMVPLIQNIGEYSGIALAPLWWALALGADIGGNTSGRTVDWWGRLEVFFPRRFD